MKVLLLGGNDNSGKTETLKRLYDWLITKKQFKCILHTPTGNIKNANDFIYSLTKDSGTITKIILNTAADDSGCIKNLYDFIKNNNLNNGDISDLLLISAIRWEEKNTNSSQKYDARKNLLDCIQNLYSQANKDYFEIPISHIDNRVWLKVKSWHECKIDETIHIVLESQKFGL